MTATQSTRFLEKNILVIDDEWRLAESLASLLRGVGYQVKPCGSGQEALDVLGESNFDLVITDLRMDGIDGFDIMRYLSEHCPKTAIIVITGHASTESAIEALHQRVSDYIPKPFDFDFLRASIEKVFAQQENEQLRRDLMRMLSHDIKVPLTGILGYAQLMGAESSRHNIPPRECAVRIMANCHRVLSMLDNYLTNARDEEGHLTVHRMPVSPRELMEESVKLLIWEFTRRNLELRRHFPAEDIRVMADEPLLERAIGNLLSNAAKYTPEDGWVELSTSMNNEGDIILSVANSGAPDYLEDPSRLFDRYQRGQSAAGTDGSGLGLHVVRLIAEAHGGWAECRIEEGHVIRFLMCLPRGTM